jgi:AGCS family alanine or glycine:cation symporter
VQSVTGKDDSVFRTSGGAIFFGLLIAAVVALVLIGGMRSIGAVTSRLVPAMAILYVGACLVVILFNVTEVPNAFGEIYRGAFSPEGVVGGVIGAIIQGFRRAAFSNEAGIGSAPIAHSAVKTKQPATEGLVAMIEPFIDTVVICTMTALTIVVANPASWQEARDKAAGGAAPESGVALTSDAFETVLPWFPYVLTVAVLLFAVSTIITWSYYGLKAWTYLFGRNRVSDLSYKVVFSLTVVTGAIMSLPALVTMADSFLFLAAVFNIIGLYFLAPLVRRELRKVLDYVRRRDAGETDEQIEASGGDGDAPGRGMAAAR